MAWKVAEIWRKWKPLLCINCTFKLSLVFCSAWHSSSYWGSRFFNSQTVETEFKKTNRTYLADARLAQEKIRLCSTKWPSLMLFCWEWPRRCERAWKVRSPETDSIRNAWLLLICFSGGSLSITGESSSICAKSTYFYFLPGVIAAKRKLHPVVDCLYLKIVHQAWIAKTNKMEVN